MTVPSRRLALTLGLGLLGLVVCAFGQAPRAANDPRPPTATIGTVDIGVIFDGYKKVKDSSETFKADITAKRSELDRMVAKARRDAEGLAALQPGTQPHTDLEARLKQSGAQIEASRKQADAEFAQRQGSLLNGIYKEVQETVGSIARERGLTLVIRTANKPGELANPATAMAILERDIVYADPRLDITQEVLARLNSK